MKRTLILESIINFDEGDRVILNPDYTKGIRDYDKIKRRIGTVNKIIGFTVTVTWYNSDYQQKLTTENNYKNLKILKKNGQL